MWCPPLRGGAALCTIRRFEMGNRHQIFRVSLEPDQYLQSDGGAEAVIYDRNWNPIQTSHSRPVIHSGLAPTREVSRLAFNLVAKPSPAWTYAS